MTPHAACTLVLRGDGLVLAVERRDMPDKWGLPGGKLEENETSREAAARELYEEARVIVHPVKDLTPIFMTTSLHDHVVEIFRASSWRGTPERGDAGRVGWVSWATLFNGPFEKTLRQLRDSLQDPRRSTYKATTEESA